MNFCVLSETIKQAVLSAEIQRRLINMDKDFPREERNKILDELGIKIKRFGYNKVARL